MPRCLVVDDSRIVRRFVISVLSKLQMRISEAENGAEALELCATDMPDIVLLDWNMPILDGLGFLKELRQMPSGHVPKVIFCTTESGLSHIESAIGHGANEYIMKPFDEEILTSKLRLVGAI